MNVNRLTKLQSQRAFSRMSSDAVHTVMLRLTGGARKSVLTLIQLSQWASFVQSQHLPVQEPAFFEHCLGLCHSCDVERRTLRVACMLFGSGDRRFYAFGESSVGGHFVRWWTMVGQVTCMHSARCPVRAMPE